MWTRVAKIVTAWLRKNGENEEMEIHSIHFLIFSLFPPSLSISYIKNCLILSQNVRYKTFVANVKKTYLTRYEKMILGRIRCEKAWCGLESTAVSIFVLILVELTIQPI